MTNISGPELDSVYDPASIERDIYQRWMEAGVFTARAERSVQAGGDRVPFTIVMPPPNVTGVLHMGHGLNNTVQDVLVRWRRMARDEALWVPGTDHAGIATQNVVEKQLAREGRTRFDLGRDAFVERVHAWVEKTGGTIVEQLHAIGASADWTRLTYTLDPGPSRAVRETFVHLYEKGLIYRGHRVHHWCPRCLTSLSDEEAEHGEEAGKLYHIAYPLADDAARAITIATTRPETMLGDVAVAVHPDDERYRDLIGRRVRLPVSRLEIPIIADMYVDPAFGTGALKITPAHDPNDFEVGKRHGLPMPVIMTPAATIGEVADAAGRVPDSLAGLDRFAARERIVEMLKASGDLVKIEPHQHAVRHCYRCDTIVEPRLSDQWFVRMEPLARPALEAVRSGRVRILPERHEAVYVNWLENIRDWNISRQLWWGHRIPVWYCDACGTTSASRTDLDACPSCRGAVRQDDDVLDTWFSSALWPFSTLGWPDRGAKDLAAFYPTDVLVTAPEILFFWVARMVMMGYEMMGDAPFHTVYLTGTARDTNGVRMQKSLGNGIDPLDVVSLFGADALRYTVVSKLGLGADLVLDPEDLEGSFAAGRNFATKLWNVGRFLLRNIGGERVTPLADIDPARLTRADEWILARLDAAIDDCAAAVGPARPPHGHWPEGERHAGLKLNEFAAAGRRFVWDELADWYVELTKARLLSDSSDRETARAVLLHAFDGALRLLHPVVPFITESLWQRLPGRVSGELLAAAYWPKQRGQHPERANEFEIARAAVVTLRQMRAEYGIQPGKQVDAFIVGATAAATRVFTDEAALIGRLAQASVVVAIDGGGAENRPGHEAHALLADGSQVFVPLAGAIDLEKECARVRGERDQLAKQLDTLRQRLANEGFTSRAPTHVVEGEHAKEREWSGRLEHLSAKVSSLCGA